MNDLPRKYRHWTADEIKKMIALYLDKELSLAEVGAEFGLSPTRIKRILVQNKVQIRKRTNSQKLYASFEKKRTILERETLRKLYTVDGLSLEKIADRLGTSYAVVERNFKAYGLKRRAPGRYAPASLTRELLEELYLRQRLTVPQIAERLALSEGSIDITEGSIRKKLYEFKIRKKDLKQQQLVAEKKRDKKTGDILSSSQNKINKKTRKMLTNDSKTENNKISGKCVRANKPGQKSFEKSKNKTTATNAPEFLSIAEAALLLKRHQTFIRRKLREGAFPNAVRQNGKKRRSWIIPVTDLTGYKILPVGGQRQTDPAPSTILSRLAKARIEIKSLRGYGKTEILQMVELEQSGRSAAEIAAEFRLPELVVEDILAGVAVKPLKIKMPRPEKRPPKRLPKDLLIELYVEKEIKTREILKLLSTNYRSLYINLRFYGIPLRSHRSE